MDRVEPAKNLCKKASSKNIFTLNNYFSFNLSKTIKKSIKNSILFFKRNVVAHLNNPNNVFKGIENLLSNDGILIIEVPISIKYFK